MSRPVFTEPAGRAVQEINPVKRTSVAFRLLTCLYNFVFPIALAATSPMYLRRMIRRGNWRDRFGERFGCYQADVLERLRALPSENRIWVHAVSVGELLIALKLIAALRELDPKIPIVVTTITNTARPLAEQRLPRDIVLLYAPIDMPRVVRRAFAAIRPARIALIEGEVWPNWLAAARRCDVPVHLVNARLSRRSEPRFKFFRVFFGPLFAQLSTVSVPEERDIDRWQSLGVSSEQLHCLGSIKFEQPARTSDLDRVAHFQTLLSAAFSSATASIDSRKEPVVRAKSTEWGGIGHRFILAASTHPDEERMFAQIVIELRARFPALRLLVAPRHVERSETVAGELETLGLRVVRRTSLSPDFSSPRAVDAVLIDTTGELRDWYPLAEVVFVGASLARSTTTGHNPAEPLAAGVPTICGPGTDDFADLVSALKSAGGIVAVRSADELGERIAHLLNHPEEGRAIVAQAALVLARHRGSAARNAVLLFGTTHGKLQSEE